MKVTLKFPNNFRADFSIEDKAALVQESILNALNVLVMNGLISSYNIDAKPDCHETIAKMFIAGCEAQFDREKDKFERELNELIEEWEKLNRTYWHVWADGLEFEAECDYYTYTHFFRKRARELKKKGKIKEFGLR